MNRNLRGIFLDIGINVMEDGFTGEQKMNNKPSELHGLGRKMNLRDIARHVALL